MITKTRTIQKIPNETWNLFASKSKLRGLTQREYFEELVRGDNIETITDDEQERTTPS